MGAANTHDTDPYTIDPLFYLSSLDGLLLPSDCLEHYQVLKPSLFRLQNENPPAFDLTVKQIVKKLGIKAKTVRDDLAGLAEPPAAKEARELLEKIGHTRALRLAQDYQDGKLWFGVRAGEDTLLVNSNRELLTLDKVPEGLTVKDNGFDLCRFSKDGILRFIGGGEEAGSALLTDLRAFFLRFAVFRDKRIALLLAVWALGTYCYRAFRVFAYLALRSPDKRCGKSRILDLLSLLAFNASPRVVHPTEAQLFRGPSPSTRLDSARHVRPDVPAGRRLVLPAMAWCPARKGQEADGSALRNPESSLLPSCHFWGLCGSVSLAHLRPYRQDAGSQWKRTAHQHPGHTRVEIVQHALRMRP